MSSSLENLGWAAPFDAAFRELGGQALEPARVIEEQRGQFRVVAARGVLAAGISGKLRHRTAEKGDRPAVGDWVAVHPHPEGDRATIHHVLPRKSALRRKSAHRATTSQVVAANLDTVFLVTSLNRDFNPRRLERFVAVVWESGAQPVLLLNKADLCEDPAPHVAEAERVLLGVPVHVVSARSGAGLDALGPYRGRGRTTALIGSSGVGKSTLINRLAGEELQLVRDVRDDDDRGRHTTTHRQLLVLGDGTLLIDTPGVREVALWGDESVLEGAFEDIEALGRECRFSDCSHASEPGCAVRRALEQGRLDRDRFESYSKLLRELAHLERRKGGRAMLEEKRRWKRLTVQYRKRTSHRRRGG